mmetsp:Transcript_32514/g.93635  ORF Transcript_32514/g.93635 Transcript_32514/m.93635 type:complete len:545 (+) Transcript_32514:37-1671(+)
MTASMDLGRLVQINGRYARAKVPDLRRTASGRGLDPGGTKRELLLRLLVADGYEVCDVADESKPGPAFVPTSSDLSSPGAGVAEDPYGNAHATGSSHLNPVTDPSVAAVGVCAQHSAEHGERSDKSALQTEGLRDMLANDVCASLSLNYTDLVDRLWEVWHASTQESAPCRELDDDTGYCSPVAPLALLRTYASQGRWIGFCRGHIVFEDDGVQFPAAASTPIKQRPSDAEDVPRLNLSSLWLLVALRGRYEAQASEQLLATVGAASIAAPHREALLKYLFGRAQVCELFVHDADVDSLPRALPSKLPRPEGGSKPPLTVDQLWELSRYSSSHGQFGAFGYGGQYRSEAPQESVSYSERLARLRKDFALHRRLQTNRHTPTDGTEDKPLRPVRASGSANARTPGTVAVAAAAAAAVAAAAGSGVAPRCPEQERLLADIARAREEVEWAAWKRVQAEVKVHDLSSHGETLNRMIEECEASLATATQNLAAATEHAQHLEVGEYGLRQVQPQAKRRRNDGVSRSKGRGRGKESDIQRNPALSRTLD